MKSKKPSPTEHNPYSLSDIADTTGEELTLASPEKVAQI